MSNFDSEASMSAPAMAGSSANTRMESLTPTNRPLNCKRLSLTMPGNRLLCEPMLPCSECDRDGFGQAHVAERPVGVVDGHWRGCNATTGQNRRVRIRFRSARGMPMIILVMRLFRRRHVQLSGRSPPTRRLPAERLPVSRSSDSYSSPPRRFAARSPPGDQPFQIQVSVARLATIFVRCSSAKRMRFGLPAEKILTSYPSVNGGCIANCRNCFKSNF